MSNRFFFPFNRGNVYRPGDDIDNGNVYSFKGNKVYVPVSTVRTAYPLPQCTLDHQLS